MPSIMLDFEQQVQYRQRVCAEAKKIIGPGDGRDAQHALADRLQLPPQPVTIRDHPMARRQPRDALLAGRRPENRMLGNRIEAFRVLQGITVPYRAAIHRIPRRRLGPLAAKGDRKRRDLCDACRHEGRRAAARKLRADVLRQRVVEHQAVAQHDQQNHARAARLLLCLLLDRHRLADLLDVSEDAVDLRGADADAAHIEDAVGAAMQPRDRLGT